MPRRLIAPDDREPRPEEQFADTMFDASIPKIPANSGTDPRTLVRGTDPLTSHDAVAQALPTINEQEQAIYVALRFFGGRGATVREIAAHLGGDWDYVRVARRIAGMRTKGLLVSYDGQAHDGVTRIEVVRDRCAVHVALVDGHELGEPPEAQQLRQLHQAQRIIA